MAGSAPAEHDSVAGGVDPAEEGSPAVGGLGSGRGHLQHR